MQDHPQVRVLHQEIYVALIPNATESVAEMPAVGVKIILQVNLVRMTQCVRLDTFVIIQMFAKLCFLVVYRAHRHPSVRRIFVVAS
tara:strand:- start:155 stop:412 length:258 start_codon:yes stop_codon:yes gene_type:complete